MIVDNVRPDVFANLEYGVKASVSKDASKIFTMLSTYLYSDKIGCVIYELAANAADIHKQVGSNEPFVITLPTNTNPKFSIRDYGTGLSEKNVYRLLMQYGESDKRHSSENIGGWGIGFKSVAAVSDVWNVVSYFEGMKSNYVIFIDSDGIPTCNKISTEPTTEKSGIQIDIFVKESTIYEWASKTKSTLLYFSVPYIIHENTSVLKNEFVPSSPIVKDGVMIAFKKTMCSSYNSLHVLTSSRMYTVNISEIISQMIGKAKEKIESKSSNYPKYIDSNSYIEKFIKEIIINNVLVFNVGEVDPSLSRETLQLNAKTIGAITDRVILIAEILMDDISSLLNSIVSKKNNESVRNITEFESLLAQTSKFNNYLGVEYFKNWILKELKYSCETIKNMMEKSNEYNPTNVFYLYSSRTFSTAKSSKTSWITKNSLVCDYNNFESNNQFVKDEFKWEDRKTVSYAKKLGIQTSGLYVFNESIPREERPLIVKFFEAKLSSQVKDEYKKFKVAAASKPKPKNDSDYYAKDDFYSVSKRQIMNSANCGTVNNPAWFIIADFKHTDYVESRKNYHKLLCSLSENMNIIVYRGKKKIDEAKLSGMIGYSNFDVIDIDSTDFLQEAFNRVITTRIVRKNVSSSYSFKEFMNSTCSQLDKTNHRFVRRLNGKNIKLLNQKPNYSENNIMFNEIMIGSAFFNYKNSLSKVSKPVDNNEDYSEKYKMVYGLSDYCENDMFFTIVDKLYPNTFAKIKG